MTATLTKTLYRDEKQGRFVYIVWDGERAMHHRLPKGVRTLEEAQELVDDLGLDMAYCPGLYDNHGWGQPFGGTPCTTT